MAVSESELPCVTDELATQVCAHVDETLSWNPTGHESEIKGHAAVGRSGMAQRNDVVQPSELDIAFQPVEQEVTGGSATGQIGLLEVGFDDEPVVPHNCTMSERVRNPTSP